MAVVKWEKGMRANPSTDVCIRLYMFDHLKKTKDKDFQAAAMERTNENWLTCFVKDFKFEGRCGPENLSEVLGTFRAWAENNISETRNS